MKNAGAGADQAATPLVTGRVLITTRVSAFAGATMHVYLEDVSNADSGAVLMAECSVLDIRHTPSRREETSIPFALHTTPESAPIDALHSYSVRVWVDCDSDGKQGANDLYSDQSYRVLSRGFGNTVTIILDTQPSPSIS